MGLPGTELSKTNTVYLIDLPGCGLSEHPSIIYTSYMYTQLVNDFIHDIIKKRAFVIATGNSAAFVIEACGINENAFEDLILINPESIRTFRKAPSKRTKSAVFILKLIIIVEGFFSEFSGSQHVVNKSSNDF